MKADLILLCGTVPRPLNFKILDLFLISESASSRLHVSTTNNLLLESISEHFVSIFTTA